MHQTEIPRPQLGLCRCSDSAPARSLSQASYTDGRGRGGGGGGGWGWRAVRGVCCRSPSPPIPCFESAKTLLFGT